MILAGWKRISGGQLYAHGTWLARDRRRPIEVTAMVRGDSAEAFLCVHSVHISCRSACHFTVLFSSWVWSRLDIHNCEPKVDVDLGYVAHSIDPFFVFTIQGKPVIPIEPIRVR